VIPREPASKKVINVRVSLYLSTRSSVDVNGRGFAIGLSKVVFDPTDPVNANPLMNMHVGPVLYNDGATKRRHALAANKAAAILQMAMQYAHRHLRQKNLFLGFSDRLAREVLASPLIWNCLTCKHPAYAREMRSA
jgi:hypothetical protein